ncbi:aminodeoxychorismate lyase [Aestuariibacter halophilus]|uniref:Aminodeoxychorismate lyase n=1 Tax=Fluctibacter halophilus TaxID=226011 RepID=A0ABS8G512_9ALTE|nr:aminodeoxychorismate lyase [Aestuariibacter halophilus]MCC2615635.1 aminodeoxychorismate lyase [Aestuariibacter halophilus]
MSNIQLATSTQNAWALDRGLHFGDGHFTTARVMGGEIELLADHLQRLKRGCERLGIGFVDWQPLVLAMNQQADALGEGVLKVVVTRGSGGRGYDPAGAKEPQAIISTHPSPAHYEVWRAQGIGVGISAVTLGHQPLLAGLKHLNRLEQVLIKQHLSTTTFDDVLVCDQHNKVIEASAANVLVCDSNGVWKTPLLSECGVEGVMRNHLIALAAANGICIEQQPLSLDSLSNAKALFLTNCLMIAVPVVQLHAGAKVFELDSLSVAVPWRSNG